MLIRIHVHKADLLGDDITSSNSQGTVNVQSPVVVQNSQDLLAEIFGSGPASTSSSVPAAPAKSSVDDILGLFGATSAPTASSSAPVPAVSATPVSLFSSGPTSPPPAPAPAAPIAPRLQSYSAYDKNELRITLTPQVSAARPGVVNILVKFQVTGTNPATEINFQAAVPKVLLLLPYDLSDN